MKIKTMNIQMMISQSPRKRMINLKKMFITLMLIVMISLVILVINKHLMNLKRKKKKRKRKILTQNS